MGGTAIQARRIELIEVLERIKEEVWRGEVRIGIGIQVGICPMDQKGKGRRRRSPERGKGAIFRGVFWKKIITVEWRWGPNNQLSQDMPGKSLINHTNREKQIERYRIEMLL